MGWCVECSTAKEFIRRECARETPPEVQDWKCEGCEDAATALKTMKACPGCGIMTERTSGCGHMICPMEGCGTEWCYFCGSAMADNIYAHMAQLHSEEQLAQFGDEGWDELELELGVNLDDPDDSDMEYEDEMEF